METDIIIVETLVKTLSEELRKKQIIAAFETAELIQWRLKRMIEIMTTPEGKIKDTASPP